MVSAIITADENWGISVDGHIPFICDEIADHQKNIRRDGTLIWGKNAYESGENCFTTDVLKNNYVITHNPKNYGMLDVDNELPVDMSYIKKILLKNRFTDRQYYIVGGVSTFKQLFKYCQKIYLTKVYKTFDHVDGHFPNLDHDSNWELTDISRLEMVQNTQYRYCLYERKGGK